MNLEEQVKNVAKALYHGKTPEKTMQDIERECVSYELGFLDREIPLRTRKRIATRTAKSKIEQAIFAVNN